MKNILRTGLFRAVAASACKNHVRTDLVMTPRIASRRYRLLRSSLLGLGAGILLLGATRAQADSFDFSNIQFWIGSGVNETALVIDWNTGGQTESLVWGFRWNLSGSGDAPTVLDMLNAIQAADPRLQITAHPKYTTADFYGVYSVYFDLTGKGGSPTVGTPIDSGGQEDGHAPFAGDLYKEGWITGFWGQVVGIDNPYNGGSWSSDYPLAAGFGSTLLTNGGWEGMSFSTDVTNYTIPSPGVPVAVQAVPEPGSFPMLLLATAGFASWRLRRRA